MHLQLYNVEYDVTHLCDKTKDPMICINHPFLAALCTKFLGIFMSLGGLFM